MEVNIDGYQVAVYYNKTLKNSNQEIGDNQLQTTVLLKFEIDSLDELVQRYGVQKQYV